MTRPINEEPWVHIPNASDLANWATEDEIAFNQTKRFMLVASLYADAFDFLKTNEVKGDYFEFGCHRVRTFRLALTEARRQNITDMNFLAFDSFAGFTEESPGAGVESWKKGQLSTAESKFWETVKEHGLFVDDIRTFKGSYADTLNSELQSSLIEDGHKAAMITVDCDLYESALEVFKFIGPFLQEGTLIYIRGAFSGYKGSPRRTVARAFEEHRGALGYQFAEFNNLGWLGVSYVTYE
jgi:hypothetical protein